MDPGCVITHASESERCGRAQGEEMSHVQLRTVSYIYRVFTTSVQVGRAVMEKSTLNGVVALRLNATTALAVNIAPTAKSVPF